MPSLYYDRPKKKKRPAPEPEIRREPEADASDTKEEKREKERFSALKFWFSTPNRPSPEEEKEAEAYIPPVRAAHRKRHPVLKLAAFLIAAAALCAFLLYLLPPGLFAARNKSNYLAANSLPSGYTHVLLLGIDRDTSGTSRSDTMMILSVGKGSVKLTSLMRDTGVTIPGRSGSNRLNAAYAYGGAELTLQTVNQNFGLNITRYALVDYDSFPELIDLIGGVTIDVTAEEAAQINRNMQEVYYRRYQSGALSYDDAYSAFLSDLLSEGGEKLHLNGMQALGYARIRNLDSDYGRTNRQRKVLSAAVSSLKGFVIRPVSLTYIAARAISMVETNMNVLEILSLGEKALFSGSVAQTRLPANGTYHDDGGMFYNVDFAANHSIFVDFVYGENKN